MRCGIPVSSSAGNEEQTHRNEVVYEYRLMAERAFEYWVRIVRWTCDDFRIGRNRGESFDSGWSTHIVDVEANATG
jgi:hypothetical protein